MAIPQPRTVNDNKVRILWTDEKTEYLIDQLKECIEMMNFGN